MNNEIVEVIFIDQTYHCTHRYTLRTDLFEYDSWYQKPLVCYSFYARAKIKKNVVNNEFLYHMGTPRVNEKPNAIKQYRVFGG